MTTTPTTATGDPTPRWMLVRIALETSVHHPRADEDRLAAMDVATVRDYGGVLARIYGFEAVVEDALGRVTGFDRSLLHERAKTSHLHQDLLALGLTPDEVANLPRATNVHVRSVPQALGWMYVIERQTLLSGLLRRHLEHRLGDEIKKATRYLAAYGETPGARFRAFGDALTSYARSYPPSTFVVAAGEAFRAQRQWYTLAARQRPSAPTLSGAVASNGSR